MIKVLHLIWSGHFGGIERLVFDLASAQVASQAAGVAVMFGRPSGEFFEIFQEAGIPCLSVGLQSGLDVSPWKFLKVIVLFRGFDILHLHTFNPFLALAAVVSGKRIIYTEHGNFGFGREQKAQDFIKARLLKIFLNTSVDFVSFNSDFTRKVAEARYGLHDVHRGVVYNGISLLEEGIRSHERDAPISTSELQGKFIVGTCSRFVGFKRIDRLISAFGEFADGKKDVALLLVGDGILRRELEKVVEELGLREKTIFTGYQEDVKYFQSLMDACVFPSEGEPFGLAAVECLALGKPVIVFRNGGGLAEIVTGVSPDDVVTDVAMLAKRLEFYFTNRAALREYAGARRSYTENFNIKHMAEEFGRAYRRVMGCAA